MSRTAPHAQLVAPPSRAALRQAIERRFRRELDLSPGRRLGVESPHLTAVYVDRHLRLTEIVVLDVPAACTFAGLALGRSSTWVRQQMHADTPDARLLAGLESALDCFVPALATRHGGEPIHFYAVHGRHRPVPSDIVALSQSLRPRDDVGFAVPGFGRGHFSIVLA